MTCRWADARPKSLDSAMTDDLLGGESSIVQRWWERRTLPLGTARSGQALNTGLRDPAVRLYNHPNEAPTLPVEPAHERLHLMRLRCPGPVAPMAEQRTFNPKRVGSSPTGPTDHRPDRYVGM